MTHAERILIALDERLNAPVELTLYGRAAFQLGFVNPPSEYAVSRDVDAVLWLGQAEALAASSNFWEALEAINQELAEQELYLSHLFEEDQVVLLPDWRQNRIPLSGRWRRLRLFRLGNVDLLLTKLMRDDPLDRNDAEFIIQQAGLRREEIVQAIQKARIPPIPEIQKQFNICAKRWLNPD